MHNFRRTGVLFPKILLDLDTFTVDGTHICSEFSADVIVGILSLDNAALARVFDELPTKESTTWLPSEFAR
ncbi:hypothetical protein GCM10023063_04380 [Arthrobacter methylotrophus]